MAAKLGIKNGATFKNIDGKELLITYKKDQFGNTTLLARPVIIHADERFDPKTIDIIQERLRSGARGAGEATKPALPDLLERAEKTGRASILVAIDKQTLHRVTLLKNNDGSFMLMYAEAGISESEVQHAGIDGADAKRLRENGGAILTKLFELAMGSSTKRAEYVLKSPTGSIDWATKVIVQLHVKEDGTVTFGISSPLAKGGSKLVRKVMRFGARIKDYAEATPLGRVAEREAKAQQEAEKLSQFAHPRILKLRKVYMRDVSTFNEGRDSGSETMSIPQAGLRTELCEKGSAVALTLTPCTPKSKECIEKLQVAYDAACALAHIHAKDRVDGSEEPVYAHMDFKPANLFITGDPPVGILGDINPRKVGAPSPTTIAYADFESIKYSSSAHPANDVWALGLTLFEFMYGKDANPFLNPELNRSDEASFRAAHEELLKRLKNGPIDDLIRSMLQWERKDRPKLDDAFLTRFERVIAEQRSEAPVSSFREGPLSPKFGPSSPSSSPSQPEPAPIARGTKSASFAAPQPTLSPPGQSGHLSPGARSLYPSLTQV